MPLNKRIISVNLEGLCVTGMLTNLFRSKSLYLEVTGKIFFLSLSNYSFVYVGYGLLFVNPLKPNGFFHPYYSEESILHFRGIRLIISSLA